MQTDALTRRYVAALSLVALLSLFGQAVVQFALSRQQVDSDFVNIAGRQRMLSQRLTQLTLRHAYAIDRAERARLAATLKTTVAQWQAAHRALRHGDAAQGTTAVPSPQVAGLLERVAGDLAAMAQASSEVVAHDGARPAEVIAALERLLTFESQFLERMDRIVFLAAEEAADRVITLRLIEAGLLLLLLLTLVAEGLLVFRPAARAIASAIERLTATAQALRRAEAHRTAVIAALPDLLLRVDRDGRCLERLSRPSTWPGAGDSAVPRVGEPVGPELRAALKAGQAQGEATVDICLEQADPPRAIELRVVRLPEDEALLLARDVTALRQVERAVLDASEQTRRQVGRELHDGLCQDLAGLHMLTRRAASRAAAGQAVSAEQLGTLSDLTEHALSVGRGLTRGLYPVDLDDGGLCQGLRGLAHRLNAAHPGRVVLALDDALPPLPAPTALHLYRIAQEAMSNAARHAHPQTIAVHLAVDPAGGVVLTVQDDGHGELPRESAGLGLRSMRYRAQLINAKLEVHGQPGRGTRVSCTLPATTLVEESAAP